MNRLWVGVSFVVLFAVLLATGLSVALLYRARKKDGEEKESKDKPSEPTKTYPLLLYLSEPDAGLKGRTTVWTLDLTKTSNYEVSGTKVTVSATKNSFFDDKKTLTGRVHRFSEPVLVSRLESEKTVVPRDYVELSGLTVFFHKDKPYFYTVWHDGDYHHYSTDLSELCVGDFPYRNEDTNNPRGLDLPEGVVKKKPTVPAPTRTPATVPAQTRTPPPVPSPKRTPQPSLPLESISTVEPKLLLDVDTDFLLDTPLVDLDLLSTLDKPTSTYLCGHGSVKVERTEFGLYTKWVYTFLDSSVPQAPTLCPPVLRYQDEVVQLPTKEGTKELSCYSDSLGLPLLVSYQDHGVDYTWVHRGLHRWDKSDKVSVKTQLLDDVHNQILPLLSYDFSYTKNYKSGSYNVKVTEDEKLSRFFGSEFVCYSHEPTFLTSAPKIQTKVHHYRVKGVLLEGLPTDTCVKKATSCFWRQNLRRPLALYLEREDKTTYHYGFPKYDEEDDESYLVKRVNLLNQTLNKS